MGRQGAHDPRAAGVDALMAGQVVIAGGGQGGYQVAASLRQNGFDGRIWLVAAEPVPPYQRPPLSKAYLAGKATVDSLAMRPESFYREHKIELLAGERLSAIDRQAGRVALASGAALDFDHLVLALGARNRSLDVPGAELEGVLSLRSLADADRLKARLAEARQVVVVGAGFIGLEFAAVAAARGCAVHVVEALERPLARAVSPAMAAFFRRWHEAHGVTFHFGSTLRALHGADRHVTGVATAQGRRIPCDMVLIGVGVVPETELAAASGLAVGNGITVDPLLRTADPRISAIGDCAFYPSRFARGMARLESVQNAVDQGRAVAARIAGKAALPYDAVPWFWSDQGELRLNIVGVTSGFDQTVIRGDVDGQAFAVLCFADGRLLGIETVNRPAEHAIGRRLLADRTALTPAQAADPAFDLKALAGASRKR